MTTVVKGIKYTNFLPAGQKATFVTPAAATAVVKRFNNGTTELDSNTMAESSTLTLGPYLSDCRYEVECLTGTLTAVNSELTTRQFLMAGDLSALTTVGAAVLSTAQVSNLTTTQLSALCTNMDILTNKVAALTAGTGI